MFSEIHPIRQPMNITNISCCRKCYWQRKENVKEVIFNGYLFILNGTSALLNMMWIVQYYTVVCLVARGLTSFPGKQSGHSWKMYWFSCSHSKGTPFGLHLTQMLWENFKQNISGPWDWCLHFGGEGKRQKGTGVCSVSSIAPQHL